MTNGVVNGWIFNRVEKGYCESKSRRAPQYDVYNCPKCYAEHRVTHFVNPICPVCFTCGVRVEKYNNVVYDGASCYGDD